MNGDLVDEARRSARSLLAAAVLVTMFAVLWLIAAPSQLQELLPFAIGAFGLLLGLVWIWRLSRVPTDEGAHWRFRDH